MTVRPCIHSARITHESPSKITVEQDGDWVVITVWHDERLREGVYRVAGKLAGLQAGGSCVQGDHHTVVADGRDVTLDVKVVLCEPETVSVYVKTEC